MMKFNNVLPLAGLALFILLNHVTFSAGQSNLMFLATSSNTAMSNMGTPSTLSVTMLSYNLSSVMDVTQTNSPAAKNTSLTPGGVIMSNPTNIISAPTVPHYLSTILTATSRSTKNSKLVVHPSPTSATIFVTSNSPTSVSPTTPATSSHHIFPTSVSPTTPAMSSHRIPPTPSSPTTPTSSQKSTNTTESANEGSDEGLSNAHIAAIAGGSSAAVVLVIVTIVVVHKHKKSEKHAIRPLHDVDDNVGMEMAPEENEMAHEGKKD